MPPFTQLTASGKVELKQSKPLTASSGEAIIQVQHADICGTNPSLFHCDYPVPLPHVCGHEFTGRVRSAGEGVDKKWIGKTVTAIINNTCITYGKKLCTACEKETPSYCLRPTVTGIIKHEGAFA
mgnify:CR=1 FL=1|tara:strand:+ start:139 stop:513 length:375 start_codon:yes stop_codon:yes gene_type:complete